MFSSFKSATPVSLFSRRANLWRGEPVRRRVRQWATPAQRHTVKNSGAGPARDQTLRHKPATASFPRLRQQDFSEVQRDGLHLTRCHRWKQTTGHDAERGEKYQGIQTKRPRDLCLGDSGQAFGRWSLWQVQCPVGEFDQQDFTQQDWKSVSAQPVWEQ